LRPLQRIGFSGLLAWLLCDCEAAETTKQDRSAKYDPFRASVHGFGPLIARSARTICSIHSANLAFADPKRLSGIGSGRGTEGKKTGATLAGVPQSYESAAWQHRAQWTLLENPLLVFILRLFSLLFLCLAGSCSRAAAVRP